VDPGILKKRVLGQTVYQNGRGDAGFLKKKKNLFQDISLVVA
jgi:hypothetical protein